MRTVMTGFMLPMLLIAVSFKAGAVERSHTSTIKLVYPLASGDFIIGLDVDAPLCSSMRSPTKYMYVTVGQHGMTAEGAKKIYAVALLGLSSRQEVSVVFDDSDAYCYINRMSVYN